jgi:hypothetical protein
VVRERVLAPRSLIARIDRLQEHGLRVPPPTPRYLASFAMRVGSGRTGRARHLDRAVAGRLSERLRPHAPAG